MLSTLSARALWEFVTKLIETCCSGFWCHWTRISWRQRSQRYLVLPERTVFTSSYNVLQKTFADLFVKCYLGVLGSASTSETITAMMFVFSDPQKPRVTSFDQFCNTVGTRYIEGGCLIFRFCDSKKPLVKKLNSFPSILPNLWILRDVLLKCIFLKHKCSFWKYIDGICG